MNKKITVFLMFTLISSTALAADLFKETEKQFSNNPIMITRSDVVSIQPDIITDAECAKAFPSKTVFQAHAHKYHSQEIDILDRKVSFSPINDELTAITGSSEAIIHLSDNKTLVSPKLSSYEINNKTYEGSGQFFTYYCRGDSHVQLSK